MQPGLKAHVAHVVEITFEGHTDKAKTQHVMERGLPFPPAQAGSEGVMAD